MSSWAQKTSPCITEVIEPVVNFMYLGSWTSETQSVNVTSKGDCQLGQLPTKREKCGTQGYHTQQGSDSLEKL